MLNFLLSLLSVASLTLINVKFLQIYQQNGYSAKKLLLWMFRGGFACFTALLLLGAVIGAASLFFALPETVLPPLSLIFYFMFYRVSVKVPLARTKRIWRLIAALAVGDFAIAYPVICANNKFFMAVVWDLQPLFIVIIGIALLPIEALVRKYYFDRARKKLRAVKPIKIAITGSYGKTTAKNILCAMLSSRYKVVATPASFNTPGGISRAINENLSPGTEIFIAEMGARREGDIAYLARAVMPDIAVITAVGNQHLGTFGSKEGIIRAKYELIDNLPCGGKAFFNGDNDICRKYYDKYNGNKTLTGKSGSVAYRNVRMSTGGQEFDLEAGGECVRIKTRLAGDYMPGLICLCAAVALTFDITLSDIKKSVAMLQPVAHRLQILYNGSDVIIDDSFNSNEQGFVAALAVLDGYSYLIKVIITPGVVELGSEQYKINEDLGYRAGKVCDYVIVTGENSAALIKGARRAGLSERNVYHAKNMESAMEYYKKIKGTRAVLFENDLPDSYL